MGSRELLEANNSCESTLTLQTPKYTMCGRVINFWWRSVRMTYLWSCNACPEQITCVRLLQRIYVWTSIINADTPLWETVVLAMRHCLYGHKYRLEVHTYAIKQIWRTICIDSGNIKREYLGDWLMFLYCLTRLKIFLLWDISVKRDIRNINSTLPVYALKRILNCFEML